MKNLKILSLCGLVLAPLWAIAQDAPAQSTLFTNVMVFDGTSETLRDVDVLVTGNKISQISEEPLAVIASTNMSVIDGGGRTLMPGLIESHVHLNMQHMVGGYDTFEHKDWQEVGAMAAFTAQSLLMDGFTTVRDVGALHAGIRRAVDRGDAIGPRIYNAGAVISQTSGHGDWRLKGQNTLESRNTHKVAQLGLAFVVDGHDATLSAARQNLANGASLNKMMLSGGVFSSKDGLHTIQGTDEEVSAVVRASNDIIYAEFISPPHGGCPIKSPTAAPRDPKTRASVAAVTQLAPRIWGTSTKICAKKCRKFLIVPLATKTPFFSDS